MTWESVARLEVQRYEHSGRPLSMRRICDVLEMALASVERLRAGKKSASQRGAAWRSRAAGLEQYARLLRKELRAAHQHARSLKSLADQRLRDLSGASQKHFQLEDELRGVREAFDEVARQLAESANALIAERARWRVQEILQGEAIRYGIAAARSAFGALREKLAELENKRSQFESSDWCRRIQEQAEIVRDERARAARLSAECAAMQEDCRAAQDLRLDLYNKRRDLGECRQKLSDALEGAAWMRRAAARRILRLARRIRELEQSCW